MSLALARTHVPIMAEGCHSSSLPAIPPAYPVTRTIRSTRSTEGRIR
jgi:hypothetical protein